MKAFHRTRSASYLATCLRTIGSAQDVLFVGGSRGDIIGALTANGCAMSCMIVGERSLEELGGLSALTEAAPLTVSALPETLRRHRFDAVLVEDILEYLAEPLLLFADLRNALRQGGFVVAMIRGESPARAEELLLQAGYRLEQMHDVRWPLLDATVPGFIVKAFPLDISPAIRRPDEPALISQEQTTSDAVITALQEAEKSAHMLRARIAALMSQRDAWRQEVRNQHHDSGGLRAALKGLETRVSLLSRRLRDSQEVCRGLRLSLETESLARLELESTLRVRSEELKEARAKTANLENDLFASQLERSTLRTSISQVESAMADRTAQLESRTIDCEQANGQVEMLRAALATAQEAARESQKQAAKLQRLVDVYEGQISEGATYVNGLLHQIAEKQKQIEDNGLYARALEAQVAELEAIRGAAIAERLVMREYIDSLRVQVEELPRLREAQEQLAAQAEDLIGRVQAESAELVTLIDTVQASHFWKLKRWMNRLKSKVLRR